MKRPVIWIAAAFAVVPLAPAGADTQTYFNFGLSGSLFGNAFSSYFSFDEDGFSSGQANLFGPNFRASAGDIGADWNAFSLSNRSFQGIQATVPAGRFEITGIAGQTQITPSLADLFNRPPGLLAPRDPVISSTVYGLRGTYNFNRAFSLSASQVVTPDASRIEGPSIFSTALTYAPNKHTRVELEGAQSRGGNGYQIAGRRKGGRFDIAASYRRADPNFSSAGNLLLRTNRNGYNVSSGYRLSNEIHVSGTTYRYTDGFGGRSRFDGLNIGLLTPRDPDFLGRRDRPIRVNLRYQDRALVQSALIGGRTQHYQGPGLSVSGGNTGKVNLLFTYDRLNFESSGTPDTKNNRYSLSARRAFGRHNHLTLYTGLNLAETERSATLARDGDRRDLTTGFVFDSAIKNGAIILRTGLERQQSRYADESARAFATRLGAEFPLGANGRRIGVEYRKGFGGSGFLRNIYNDALYLSYRQNISIGKRVAQFSPSQLSAEQRLELGRVTARVFEDTNLNGRYDNGEQTVPNVVIALTDEVRNRTGNAGQANFPALPPNRYRLRLIVQSLPIELTQLSDSDREINIAARQNLKIDFPVSRTGTISGTVFLDANRNGRRDSGEAGLRGAVVRIAGLEILTFSETEGAFTVSNVPPGARSLEIDTQFVGGAISSYDVTTPLAPLFLNSGAGIRAGDIGLAPREAPILIGELAPSGQSISTPATPPAMPQAEPVAISLHN